MPHTLAVIGRPNVGKSTLFNRLLRQNKALIYDQPGVTRDRLYGTVRRKGMEYDLVDTGGLVLEDPEGFEEDILLQAQEAMADSQAILFVVDGQEGLTTADETAADMLRRSDKPVLLAVNKVDGPEHEGLSADFHTLGFEQITLSAAHGWHMPLLEERIEALLESLGPPPERVESIEQGLTLAVLGRPNAGKSSIVNAVTGERRLIVSDVPGTTRDSVDVTVDIGGKRYTFIDTAGVRRKQRIGMELERFSVMRALKNSKTAKVTVLVLTANEGLTMQDKKLLSLLDREKTPFIVAVNKMDLVPKNEVREAKQYFKDALRISPHVPIVYLSAIRNQGLKQILPEAEEINEQCEIRVTTGKLNRAMEDILSKHQPPLVKRRRAKFYYLTQAGVRPPTFVFFVNDPEIVKPSYARYLENGLRKLFGITKAPIRVHFRSSHDKK